MTRITSPTAATRPAAATDRLDGDHSGNIAGELLPPASPVSRVALLGGGAATTLMVWASPSPSMSRRHWEWPHPCRKWVRFASRPGQPGEAERPASGIRLENIIGQLGSAEDEDADSALLASCVATASTSGANDVIGQSTSSSVRPSAAAGARPMIEEDPLDVLRHGGERLAQLLERPGRRDRRRRHRGDGRGLAPLLLGRRAARQVQQARRTAVPARTPGPPGHRT